MKTVAKSPFHMNIYEYKGWYIQQKRPSRTGWHNPTAWKAWKGSLEDLGHMKHDASCRFDSDKRQNIARKIDDFIAKKTE